MAFDLKKVVGTVAPFLGSMIGGPFGAAAGKILGQVLLGNEDASEAEIEKALASATPETLVKLREVDANYKTKMAELGIDEQKIAAMDRDSARKREIETGDMVPALLAFLLTFGFFGTLATIIFYPLPESAQQIIDIMLGSLGTAWISVITYYFGSSHGSQIKTRLLKEK